MGKIINPFDKKITSVEGQFCGRPIKLEANKLAFQANGSVAITYGDNVILGVAMASNNITNLDYFPLSIDYEEKMYAAGKISGSRFIKREGRPSEEAILTARLIDRPIRPLFPKGYKNEVQGIATVLSLDPDLKPDAIAMAAVSTALVLTGAPFEGPVAGVRVGLIDEQLIVYPDSDQIKKTELDLFVAGTKDAIMMVEAGANEVSEEVIVEAIIKAHDAIKELCELQEKFVAEVGISEHKYEIHSTSEEVTSYVDAFLRDKLGDKIVNSNVKLRSEYISNLKELLKVDLRENDIDDISDYIESFEVAIKKEVRRLILDDNLRPDGRDNKQIRPLSSAVSILPRAHGSSLFTRGSTQGMNITTLAPASYAQVIDTMGEDKEKFFIHHYNMPGYTVGEIRRLGSPGRREIGHGALAERALIPVIPSQEVFPYMIRSVTEILSSNGSTSMAAVCSMVMSLMDAGVPITAPVSGIAMGMVSDSETGKKVILSDIMGAEDFAGDMDFKVTGTAKGVTALQMDIKLKGLSPDVLKEALAQAKEGRAFILDHMLSTISSPNKELSKYAPRIETIKIKTDQIREVIGKGGETINKIIAETGAEIDIKDDGLVMVYAANASSIDKALKMINDIVAEPEVGKIYEAKVVTITDFGAFAEFMPGKDGLIHISEISEDRIESVKDVLSLGEVVKVKLVAIDDKGRMSLSIKAAK
ncbi:MAG TPA: polyribonucleotide nucleotidyltransferase [Candidatus Saccharibacteria bacterium]|jgi:polyribonucleotide nucleotidyltransferase|nr:polyribonucleotide nucleotidyltransferase [Candidatus Saccharibacteria bacterium]